MNTSGTIGMCQLCSYSRRKKKLNQVPTKFSLGIFSTDTPVKGMYHMNECAVTYDPEKSTYTITWDRLQCTVTLGHDLFMKHLHDSTLSLDIYSHSGDGQSETFTKNKLDGRSVKKQGWMNFE